MRQALQGHSLLYSARKTEKTSIVCFIIMNYPMKLPWPMFWKKTSFSSIAWCMDIVM